ncbi:ribonuclease H-like domain-containing protein [Tanacetum coccineum]
MIKPNPRFHCHTSHISPLPKSPSVALSDPHWRDAMSDEYNALIKNGTWILVLKPPNVNVVRSMWLFRRKYHADVLSLALTWNWPIYQLDVKNAFLNGDLSETVYMHLELGFNALWVMLVVWDLLRVDVDDIVITASSTALLQRIISSLHKEFDMTDLGALNHFLEISVTRDTIGMTPIDTESKLSSEGDPVTDPTLYRSLVDFGLQLYASSTSSLVAYSVVDWAGCPITRRSTSRYCVFLDNNLHSWSSKRQHTLSHSSAEAEYRGVSNVVAETAWLRSLLHELHTPLLSATHVYCDNVSAIYMTANLVQHQQTKHIEIVIHFVHDMVARGQVRVLHVPSRYQYADIFTKGLPSALFEEF